MPQLIDRFFAKVDRTESCWNWRGGKLPKGYGLFWSVGKVVQAHRFSYEFFNGPIPTGKCVMHTCDNPSCVRPSHLIVGTIDDNQKDMVAKGRQQKGETHCFARLTEEQVREIGRWYAMRPRVHGKGTHRPRSGERNPDSFESKASEYGISEGTLRDIIRGRTWKHVL